MLESPEWVGNEWRKGMDKKLGVERAVRVLLGCGGWICRTGERMEMGGRGVCNTIYLCIHLTSKVGIKTKNIYWVKHFSLIFIFIFFKNSSLV